MANQPHICSPLSVVQNEKGKKRLVINLRHLNQYLWKTSFKYEDLRTLMQILTPSDFVFTFDLKSRYHHLDIFPQHWQYLGFTWHMGSGNKYFTFTVLPFGLSMACYAFTKLMIMRPLIRHWRGMSIRAVMYIDDEIVAVDGEHKAQEVSMAIQKDLQVAGFITNIEKSDWVPRRFATWLGFDINLESAQFVVPKFKIEALQGHIQQALSNNLISARNIARITGQVISMSLALGPIARFMTRGLYALLNNRYSWCHRLKVSPEAALELQFWLFNLESYNGQSIWHSPSAVQLVYSDASNSGYGGYIIQHGPQIAHGHWSPEEATHSSTWRESCGVQRVLESIAGSLKNGD